MVHLNREPLHSWMTRKMKLLTTRGSVFLEGLLHLVLVTATLVTQRKCLAAPTEGPALTAALCAPGAKRNADVNGWDRAGSEVEGCQTFWCSKAIKAC